MTLAMISGREVILVSSNCLNVNNALGRGRDITGFGQGKMSVKILIPLRLALEQRPFPPASGA